MGNRLTSREACVSVAGVLHSERHEAAEARCDGPPFALLVAKAFAKPTKERVY